MISTWIQSDFTFIQSDITFIQSCIKLKRYHKENNVTIVFNVISLQLDTSLNLGLKARLYHLIFKVILVSHWITRRIDFPGWYHVKNVKTPWIPYNYKPRSPCMSKIDHEYDIVNIVDISSISIPAHSDDIVVTISTLILTISYRYRQYRQQYSWRNRHKTISYRYRIDIDSNTADQTIDKVSSIAIPVH